MAEFDSAYGVKGQGQIFLQPRRVAQQVQGVDFLFQGLPIIQRIDKGGLGLKMTGNIFTKGVKIRHGLLVGLQVHSRLFTAQFVQQFVIDQAVLRGDLGGGILGYTAADAPGLYQ